MAKRESSMLVDTLRACARDAQRCSMKIGDPARRFATSSISVANVCRVWSSARVRGFARRPQDRDRRLGGVQADVVLTTRDNSTLRANLLARVVVTRLRPASTSGAARRKPKDL